MHLPPFAVLRRIALVALVVLSVVLAPEARAQWTVALPWEVMCLPDAGLDPDDCDDENVGSTANIVKSDLDLVTPWLKDLGFREPRIERTADGSSYLSHLGPPELFLGENHVYGYYQAYEKRLVVDGTHFIVIEGEEDASGTAPHELFHAIQASYPAYWADGGDPDWIMEGTAQAAEAAWITRDGPSPLVKGGHAYAYGFRNYARPIDETSQRGQEYATSHFWLALGEMLGSTDRVQYLASGLALSDLTPGALLDALSMPVHTDAFSHVFPRLLARYAADYEHYEGNRAILRVTDGYEESFSPVVQPLAGTFARIENADSEMLEVEVEFVENESLHLVFDGQQASEMALESPRYVRNLMPGEHLEMIAANVAPEATLTEAETLEITVRARRPDSCNQPPGGAFSVTITGPRGGSGQGSFPFERQSAQIGGRTVVEYPGLMIFDYGDRKQVLWKQSSEMGIGDRVALARQRLGMQSASEADVTQAIRDMPIAEMRRVLPEFFEEEEEDFDVPVVPNSIGVELSTRGGDGSHSILLKNGNSNVGISMPFSGHYGTGRVQSPTLTIGVGAPAFSGSGPEGMVLANPEVNFSAFEPGLCVAGTFSGVYESSPGQAHPVTGSFRLIVPDDATVIDMK